MKVRFSLFFFVLAIVNNLTCFLCSYGDKQTHLHIYISLPQPFPLLSGLGLRINMTSQDKPQKACMTGKARLNKYITSKIFVLLTSSHGHWD
ncbi:hypothetical protein EDC96DRAFT_72297 [Choanephora cucurbitarum]|nr:hypothetical protein EDC96DRAFT_72297 [Choanephora cucurbitarum]